MLHQSYEPFHRNSKILVTTQVVVTCHGTELLIDGPLGLDTGHPCLDLGIVLCTSHLPIVGSLGLEITRMIRQIATDELLVSVMWFFIAFATLLTPLHTDVHEQQGGT